MKKKGYCVGGKKGGGRKLIVLEQHSMVREKKRKIFLCWGKTTNTNLVRFWGAHIGKCGGKKKGGDQTRGGRHDC